MRYQVPQFIDIEDKIFGPLTLRQFIYLVAGAALCYLCYNFLPGFIAIFLILPIAGFFAALTFYKVNNKPFLSVVQNAFIYFFGGKLYIWKRVPKKIQKEEEEKVVEQLNVPRLSESRLKDLAWSLDINEKTPRTIYSNETGELEAKQESDAGLGTERL